MGSIAGMNDMDVNDNLEPYGNLYYKRGGSGGGSNGAKRRANSRQKYAKFLSRF